MYHNHMKFKIIWRRVRAVRRKRKKTSSVQYIAHKKVALALAKSRLEYFNQFYHFKISRVSIKNQKTRWGSCSKKGNLNFNYRIALLPASLADYVIVHELCHLGEFNHSKNFWNLVEKTIPNHAVIRKEFKKIRLHSSSR